MKARVPLISWDWPQLRIQRLACFWKVGCCKSDSFDRHRGLLPMVFRRSPEASRFLMRDQGNQQSPPVCLGRFLKAPSPVVVVRQPTSICNQLLWLWFPVWSFLRSKAFIICPCKVSKCPQTSQTTRPWIQVPLQILHIDTLIST